MNAATSIVDDRVGIATGEADLWCTYAAVRTLSWLDSDVPDRAGTLAYLMARRNGDGGYAWSRGMPSDAWATFYCTQAISDLGGSVPHPERTAEWLRRTFSGAAYAMMPGQEPDVWATHFSTRSAELFGVDVPDRPALVRWLGELQALDGGLSWSPAHARTGASDARACHYGIAAWRALDALAPVDPPWNVAALTRWLRGQQILGGGFRFGPDTDEPCLWATFRATTALALLGATAARPADCVAWIDDRRGPAGGFVRWTGYPVEDVWAAFCAVGALRALGAPTAHVARGVIDRIGQMACPGGGFTYREPALAADALCTAATILRAPDDDPRLHALRGWLDGCQLPNEGGVMYMPARGAEVRCTLWALSAGALSDAAARHRVGDWLVSLQNPDGGFGYWEGRASDMVSTSAATESLLHAGRTVIDLPRPLATFVESCARSYPERSYPERSYPERSYPDGGGGYANVPGGEPTLRAGLQAHRVRAALGDPDVPGISMLLERHRVAGGGYANEGCRVPDLLSTYEAIATADRYELGVDLEGLRAFLRRVTTTAGTAWSPLAPGGGGPLADCLGQLLARRLAGDGAHVPILALS